MNILKKIVLIFTFIMVCLVLYNGIYANGIDLITFEADYMGNVKLKEFKHIKSYYLPDNLKHLEKKRVPGI